MYMRILLLSACFSVVSLAGLAQNNRLNTYETIGWYNVFGTFGISEKWGVHAEYQYRRDDVIKYWQQSLLRVGVNYRMNPRVLFRVGYAWIETYPTGNPDQRVRKGFYRAPFIPDGAAFA
jgi:hypothetical protein